MFQSDSLCIEVAAVHFFGEFLSIVCAEESECREINIVHARVFESVVRVKGIGLGIEVGVCETILQQLVGGGLVDLAGSVKTILNLYFFK